ncbi:hypothetical protein ALP82_102949 [Pseudomonas savastanoi pv. fraxini]|nr:hypothetical protein PSYAE_21505 [Pseudomonas amygdali pv. aesculi str. 0893_23]KPW22323.1 hypothetical protein ALO90_103008 [Pseudomonas amygdali pv. aesculi]RMR27294.1 hypothetical protein ALP89_102584 [Pseudomonas syringae pv. persicae]RMR76986.1 hypothetical protein ALP82_102949 [Pseudomonas savastanoi pv. fraxini]
MSTTETDLEPSRLAIANFALKAVAERAQRSMVDMLEVLVLSVRGSNDVYVLCHAQA